MAKYRSEETQINHGEGNQDLNVPVEITKAFCQESFQAINDYTGTRLGAHPEFCATAI
ncbi:hypothetical protein RCH20_000582 [Psychrobacter sp. PL15]|uniref:hypothetical protein n=1 Tax=Psychrobacter sp. PL15 TaxID=3071719 RepID=UPI002DFE052F|nr:hypothetical protein [Psychrobacter sp. PL15]